MLIVLYHRQLDAFQFLEDVSGGSCRVLNSAWECPYRAVRVTCG